jgi:hypothetical protein
MLLPVRLAQEALRRLVLDRSKHRAEPGALVAEPPMIVVVVPAGLTAMEIPVQPTPAGREMLAPVAPAVLSAQMELPEPSGIPPTGLAAVPVTAVAACPVPRAVFMVVVVVVASIMAAQLYQVDPAPKASSLLRMLRCRLRPRRPRPPRGYS